jgi:hypothetical protein
MWEPRLGAKIGEHKLKIGMSVVIAELAADFAFAVLIKGEEARGFRLSLSQGKISSVELGLSSR